MRIQLRKPLFAALAVTWCIVVACATQSPGSGELNRWWAGLGPVLPHDSFPADCSLCHVGQEWNTLVKDFKFDHERETGIKLEGAHNQAKCLRCHNDRGPVRDFYDKGCLGCHEDFHYGDLGPNCTFCHTQKTWRPYGQIEMHNRTRFPLIASHTLVACNRCHPGAFVGNFMPTDTECLTCHTQELLNTQNPNHLNLGWVDNCDRCHSPTNWNDARIR